MFGVISDVGKAFIVSGVLPALLFAVANVLIFFEWAIQAEAMSFAHPPVALAVVAIVLLGALLLGLNTPIIKLYEGRTAVQRFLLRYFRKRNLSLHDSLYRDLAVYRSEYERTSDEARRGSLAHAIEGEWRRILAVQGKRYIPVDRRRILATRLGNILATIEEYPSIRYGMDGMVFWPRLAPVIPDSFAARISYEKIVFDFLLNLSLLCAVLTVEIAAVVLPQRGDPAWAAPAAGFAVLAYLLYRAATVSMVAMGELINSAFDLYRHDILKRMRLAVPRSIEQERETWSRLANYIASGEAFYYPRSEPEDDEGSAERSRVASAGH